MELRFTNSKAWKYSFLIYAFAIVAAVMMIILSYKTSQSLGETQATSVNCLWIRMSVTIPELVIWAIALRAAVRFKHYVVSIKGSDDGSRLDYIANGLLYLVAYIVALTLGSMVVQLYRDGPRFHQAVVMNNYLPLFIALVSSVYLYIGSRRLVSLVGSDGRNRRHELLKSVPFVIIIALFAFHFYMNAMGLSGDGGVPRFILPINILMISYVLPYIVMWSLGLLACVNLAWYSHNTPGTLYKKMFHNFYQGILVIIISLFFAQVLTITPLTMEVFSPGLILIYAVLVLAVFGFALVYRGTLKLEKLEAVTGDQKLRQRLTV